MSAATTSAATMQSSIAAWSRPRVLVADDHTLLAEAFAQLLDPQCEIVGIVADGLSVVTEAERLKPDVIVLDIGMPLSNGLEAGREVKRLLPRTRLVYLTMSEDPDLAAETFRIGASAFLLKSSAASELFVAICAAMNGRSYLTPCATEALVDMCTTRTGPVRPRHALTPRQREVLKLLAEGHTMKQAALMLNVAPRTVAFHKYQMMAQLHIRSTAALVQFAVKQHLV
jgi:DNA-binding NarL/FixJ family response regulator